MLCVGNSKAILLAELQSASPRAKLEPWQPARSALEADCSRRAAAPARSASDSVAGQSKKLQSAQTSGSVCA
jgi:hypothetical protein